MYAIEPADSTHPGRHGSLSPFVTRADGGTRLVVRGSTYRVMADRAQTGGAFAFLWINLHHGSEPPPHIHTHEAEGFYVLNGSLAFDSGGTLLCGRPGGFVYLPKGLQHAYQVTSPDQVSNVLLLAVPAGLERYFEVLSAHPKILQQISALQRVSKAYGVLPGFAPSEVAACTS
jgi:quercetin dioxygenase-like cupin family protein